MQMDMALTATITPYFILLKDLHLQLFGYNHKKSSLFSNWLRQSIVRLRGDLCLLMQEQKTWCCSLRWTSDNHWKSVSKNPSCKATALAQFHDASRV